jgi:hypothetical protein
MRFRAIIDRESLNIVCSASLSRVSLPRSLALSATPARSSLSPRADHVSLVCDAQPPGVKTCVLWLSPDCVRLRAAADDDALQLFATLGVSLFSEFRVESRAANVIAAEVLTANLLSALRAAAGAPAAVLKLVKVGAAPFLSVAADLVAGGVAAAQEVPVRVLGAEELERHREPALSPIAARMTFPSPAPVLSVVDHMRGLLLVGGGGGAKAAGAAAGAGGAIAITADLAERKVVFAVRTATAQVKTFFRDLVDGGGGGGGGGDDGGGGDEPPPAALHLHVGARHLHSALKGIKTLESSMLMCVVPARALILHGENASRNATLTFIIALVDVSD